MYEIIVYLLLWCWFSSSGVLQSSLLFIVLNYVKEDISNNRKRIISLLKSKSECFFESLWNFSALNESHFLESWLISASFCSLLNWFSIFVRLLQDVMSRIFSLIFWFHDFMSFTFMCIGFVFCFVIIFQIATRSELSYIFNAQISLKWHFL